MAAANELAAQRMLDTRALLVDVRPAGTRWDCNPASFADAGPPIEFARASGPLRGALIGALIFEGVAADEAEAVAHLKPDKVSVHPVSPAARGGSDGRGDLTVHVAVRADRSGDRCARMVLAERGPGKVLRYGAYGPEVITRLRWMADVLGPALAAAVAPPGRWTSPPSSARWCRWATRGTTGTVAGTLDAPPGDRCAS